MDYEEFYRPHISGFRSNGKQAYGRCPFHDDKLASFSINLFTAQYKCHGCQVVGNHITFARRIGVLPPIADGASIAHPPHPAAPSPQPRVHASGPAASVQAARTNEPRPPSNLVATHEYQYEDGTPATRVLRFEPKSFRQQRWDGKNWIWSLEGARRVPYRLPKILAAKEIIYLVEGEKDVETLERSGLTATTTSMGASSWQKEYAQYFKGKFIAILPDNDEPGEKYARTAARDLHDASARVKIVRLPRLPEKGDVSDFLAGIGTLEELQALVRTAAPFAEITESPLDPIAYFQSKGIEAYPHGSLIPNQYRAACKNLFTAFAAIAGRCTGAVLAKLDAAEETWKGCTSKKEYEKFIRILKEAHELSLIEQ